MEETGGWFFQPAFESPSFPGCAASVAVAALASPTDLRKSRLFGMKKSTTLLHQNLTVIALMSLASSTASAREPVRVERSASVMGTIFSVEMYGADAKRLETVGDLALSEARRIDALLSNYRPDSELSKLNAEAARKPVRISQELFDLLSACMRVSRESDGAFDITVGPLMKAWGFFRDSGHVPAPNVLGSARAHVGYQKVRLDPATRSVRFRSVGMELDPGGVGKGYAVDRMAMILRREGIVAALISAGGSSIYGIGSPPGNARGWLVHIVDPRDPQKTIAGAFLKNSSLSTSGSYEKFFWADGKVYSHIMDPRTGYPAQGLIAVSVIAPTTLASELWTKPYFILGAGWAEHHLRPGFRVFVCPATVGAACSWLE